MKVLVIGSGGREHALVDCISKSPKVSHIFVSPGNAGMESQAIGLDIPVDDIDALLAFAHSEHIGLTIVGPEIPLVAGITDVFEENGLKVFGVNKVCAQFEGSKEFTKEFLMKYNIPTAGYLSTSDVQEAMNNIGVYGYPMVIKADGLAGGKGVILAENESEAKTALDDIMVKKVFGGSKVVIEEYLTGVEASILCFVDGKTITPMETAKDHKRALDGDLGLNTGGMGTFSPSNLMDDSLQKVIRDTILDPIIQGFQSENLDYKGILFIGLMIENNVPKVLEFNVRLGDPETQVVLPRLETDFIEIVEEILAQRLDSCEIKWKKEHSACVVLTAKGYPEAYPKGDVITGLDQVDSDIILYHAGTIKKGEDIVTHGGRVLNVVALGNTLEEAREKVYKNVEKIHFEGKTFRSDIGKI